jgi:uncharacterized protein (TIGR02594 family)
MKIVYSIFLISILGACSVAETDSVITAQPYLGLQERQDRQQLRELVGVDPVRTEWCAAFVNAVLEKDGIPNLNNQTQYPPLMARSFIHWGERVLKTEIRRGDVVVFPRGNQGWQGHVGFFVEEQNGYWVILGGNQDQSVNYQLFDPRRVIAVRRYIDPDSIKQERLAWLLKI